MGPLMPSWMTLQDRGNCVIKVGRVAEHLKGLSFSVFWAAWALVRGWWSRMDAQQLLPYLNRLALALLRDEPDSRNLPVQGKAGPILQYYTTCPLVCRNLTNKGAPAPM